MRTKATLLAVVLLATLEGDAAARHGRDRGVGNAAARHSWDRGVGSKQGYRATASERRRLAVGPLQDVRISIPALGRELEELQRRDPARMKLTVLERIEGLPMYRVDLADPAPAKSQKRSVLISAGVHGNEPTAVRTALQLISKALHDKGLLQRYRFTILTDVNPVGLTVPQRLNGAIYNEGRDINRSFAPGAWTPESAAIARSFASERFNVFIDLHGAADSGFFLYRHKDDGTLSRRILGALASGLLLDPKGPHGHALGGVQEVLGNDFESWMGQRADYSYTLEYPRLLAPQRQLRGLTKLLLSTLNNVGSRGRFQPTPAP